jgi:hypothetical protein
MRSAFLLVTILAVVVTSCEQPPEYLSATQINATVTAAVATAQAAMRTPSITPTVMPTVPPTATGTRTSTPTLTPTWTQTPTATWTRTLTGTLALARTLTAMPTPTPTITPTITPVPPKVNTTLLGCEMGLDITHGMGDVTNAYVRFRNLSDNELTNICFTLSLDNEGRPHPDKVRCIPSLRPNYEVTLKLTVDTDSRTPNSAAVAVMIPQGVIDKVSSPGCRLLTSSELGQITPILNVTRVIP